MCWYVSCFGTLRRVLWLLALAGWCVDTVFVTETLLFRWFTMIRAGAVQDSGTACSDLNILQLGTT